MINTDCMDPFLQIVQRIIKEQELIIGPLAWREAKRVQGLKFKDADPDSIALSGKNPQTTIDNLVKQYGRLFGRASEEVCRDAVKDLLADLPQDKIPASLR